MHEQMQGDAEEKNGKTQGYEAQACCLETKKEGKYDKYNQKGSAGC